VQEHVKKNHVDINTKCQNSRPRKTAKTEKQ